MSKFTPSKYQQAIYDFVEKGKGNLIVNAVAGSGKTTTIVNALKLIPETKTVCFLAFNKSIVSELKTRVSSKVNVQTLHSLGWSAMIKNLTRPILNNSKVDGIINVMSKSWEFETNQFNKQNGESIAIDYEYKQRVKKLVDLIRINLIDKGDINKLLELALKNSI